MTLKLAHLMVYVFQIIHVFVSMGIMDIIVQPLVVSDYQQIIPMPVVVKENVLRRILVIATLVFMERTVTLFFALGNLKTTPQFVLEKEFVLVQMFALAMMDILVPKY